MGDKNWSQLWLDYEAKACENKSASGNGGQLKVETGEFDSENRVIKSAVKELNRAFADTDKPVVISFVKDAQLPKEGYRVGSVIGGSDNRVVNPEATELIISAADENGALYGAFHVIRSKVMGEDLGLISVEKAPSNPLRMMNHWDNMDGSIERGYSGNSFFYEKDEIVINERTVDYARFMASIGINGIVINNVNVKGEASYLISKCFALNGNYSYLEMETPVVGAPKHKAYLGGVFNKGSWHASTGLQYINSLYTTAKQLQPATVLANPDIKEDFLLWNARVSYQLSDMIQLWVNGDNLLDTDYQINDGYPMPGIAFMAGVNLSF